MFPAPCVVLPFCAKTNYSSMSRCNSILVALFSGRRTGWRQGWVIPCLPLLPDRQTAVILPPTHLPTLSLCILPLPALWCAFATPYLPAVVFPHHPTTVFPSFPILLAKLPTTGIHTFLSPSSSGTCNLHVFYFCPSFVFMCVLGWDLVSSAISGMVISLKAWQQAG